MCTTSYWPTSTGFILAASRDESPNRKPAQPPRLIPTASGQLLAPIDPEGQGSWIGVNQSGWALNLLNRYDGKPSQNPRSRGTLVLDGLAAVPNLSVSDYLHHQDLTRYNPFYLLGVSWTHPPVLFSWDGHILSEQPHPQFPVVSASEFESESRQYRQKAFQNRLPNPDIHADILAFHSTHHPSNPEWGICLHEPNRQTLSLSVLDVTKTAIKLTYYPGNPCQTPTPVHHSLTYPALA